MQEKLMDEKKIEIWNRGKSSGTEKVFQSGGNEKERNFEFCAYEKLCSPSQKCHGDFVNTL